MIPAGPSPPRPTILLLATGGTIAGAPLQDDPGGYRSGQLGPDALLSAAPGMAGIADFRTETLAAVGSQDIDETHWRQLAGRVAVAFAEDALDAILISHGTDTMEETAFFLDLVLPPAKPVVLFGATRAAAAPGADGPANFQDAARVACRPGAAGLGVVVVGDGTVHSAGDVQKVHINSAAAFASPNAGPIGFVEAGAVRFDRGRRAKEGALFPIPREPLPRVEIVFAYAGVDAGPVEDAVARGARGLVLAGVGRGNASAATMEALSRAARRGIAVVRASRVPQGVVTPGREVDDRTHGFLVALAYPPSKARILLQLILANGIADHDARQTLFDGGHRDAESG